MYSHFTFTLMAHCTSGAIRGSVSCSRTLLSTSHRSSSTSPSEHKQHRGPQTYYLTTLSLEPSHTHTHTHTRIHTHLCEHTHTHTHTRAYTHTCVNTHTHTHTHTLSLSFSLCLTSSSVYLPLSFFLPLSYGQI